jgi:hypothetical protein
LLTSGILALRKYCIGIVAESHLRAAINYVENQVPALLGSVQLWIDAGSGTASVEGKEKLLEVVEEAQRDFDKV